MAVKKTTLRRSSGQAKKAAKNAPTKKVTKKTSSKKAAVKKTTPKKVVHSSTFAVIETGGKQYRVSQNEVIIVEKIPGVGEGKKVIFEKVLLVDNGKDTQIGDPYLKGAKVEGVLEEEGLAKKVNVVRFKSKSRYLKRKGHRQPYAKVRIEAIR